MNVPKASRRFSGKPIAPRDVPEEENTSSNMKVCILFDHGESARHAKAMVKRMSRRDTWELELHRIGELGMLAVLYETAYASRDADLIVVAVGETMEPSSIKAWLSLCLSYRDADLPAPMVAFATSRAAIGNWSGCLSCGGFNRHFAKRSLSEATVKSRPDESEFRHRMV